MDPHCRTRVGFQSLVQKEWIMGGHCFLDRCNHLRQSDKEEVSVLITDFQSWGGVPTSYLFLSSDIGLLFAKCTLHKLSGKAVIHSLSDDFECFNQYWNPSQRGEINKCVQSLLFWIVYTSVSLFHGESNIGLQNKSTVNSVRETPTISAQLVFAEKWIIRVQVSCRTFIITQSKFSLHKNLFKIEHSALHHQDLSSGVCERCVCTASSAFWLCELLQARPSEFKHRSISVIVQLVKMSPPNCGVLLVLAVDSTGCIINDCARKN